MAIGVELEMSETMLSSLVLPCGDVSSGLWISALRLGSCWISPSAARSAAASDGADSATVWSVGSVFLWTVSSTTGSIGCNCPCSRLAKSRVTAVSPAVALPVLTALSVAVAWVGLGSVVTMVTDMYIPSWRVLLKP